MSTRFTHFQVAHCIAKLTKSRSHAFNSLSHVVPRHATQQRRHI